MYLMRDGLSTLGQLEKCSSPIDEIQIEFDSINKMNYLIDYGPSRGIHDTVNTKIIAKLNIEQ